MKDKLENTAEKDLPVIFIPSYKRPHFELSKRILPSFSKTALQKVFVVVRAEQVDKYHKANPQFQYVVIPKGAVTGLGSTRRWILDYAIQNRYSCIMDMDDDIKYLQFLFNRRTSNGNICSAHTGVRDWVDDPRIPQKVLQLAGQISRQVFKDHPEAVFGNIRKQRFSNHAQCAQTMYQINKGPTPRQTTIMNARMMHKHNLHLPEAFDLHTTDMGYVSGILQEGFSCFNIPCLCYDYIDDALNSVVRDPKNPDSTANRRLHKMGYDALQQMEVRHYLRETFKFDDGAFKFGDIAWNRYHKLRGTKPITKYWRE